ncbi:MAG: hypothetical protein ACODAJ_05405 [Planctomycetota bacterium]
MVVGLGYAHVRRHGWHGRLADAPDLQGRLRVLGGVPLLYNYESWRGYRDESEAHYRVVTYGPFVTQRDYPDPGDADAPHVLPDPSDPYWVGLTVNRFASFSLGFNVAQFADCLAGLGGGDPLGDDGSPRVTATAVERGADRPENQVVLKEADEEPGAEAWAQ